MTIITSHRSFDYVAKNKEKLTVKMSNLLELFSGKTGLYGLPRRFIPIKTSPHNKTRKSFFLNNQLIHEVE